MKAEWWLWPLLMCLVLTGIHGYLGLHVLRRKVIFVDLAMAQIAALGAAYGVLLGYDPKQEGSALPLYLFSLGFTLAGAAVVALTRMRRERVPHEAIIGVVYAGASALAVLILAKTPTEGEQIRHMLVGSLLTVRGERVAVTAAVYAAIGLFHWAFRRQFFRISEDPEAAAREGIRVRLWDFLFYLSFGLVITSSVSVAGVLLVFSYLVVPAVIAVLFVGGTAARIGAAWAVGAAVSVAGITASNIGDLPTGPCVVACFVAALAVAGAVHYIASSERSGVAARRLAAGGVAAALALWGTSFLRRAPEEHAHGAGDPLARWQAELASDDETRVIDAIHHLEEGRDPHAAAPILDLLTRTRSDRVIEHAAEALAKLEAGEAAPVLRAIAGGDLDGGLRVAVARALLDLRDPAGFPVLVDVLEKEPARTAREEAKRLIEERTGMRLDFAVDPEPSASRPAIDRLKAWWAQRGPSLRWRRETGRFE